MGYDVTTTMRIAQKLYENGHITYMRTDSVNLSKLAMGAAKEEIHKTFGEKYSQVRNYTTKNESAQEAHEAIRPTNFGVQFAGDDNREKKLYSLIWKRSIASQMAKAEMEKTAAQNDPVRERDDLLTGLLTVPVTASACKVKSPGGSTEVCKTNGWDDLDKIKFWKTPTAKCSTQGTCVPYAKWTMDYIAIMGGR